MRLYCILHQPEATIHCILEVVIAYHVVGPHPTPSVLAIPIVDEFYNAIGKASHPNAIGPKRKSGWWIN